MQIIKIIIGYVLNYKAPINIEAELADDKNNK